MQAANAKVPRRAPCQTVQSQDGKWLPHRAPWIAVKKLARIFAIYTAWMRYMHAKVQQT
jgi:hypothetical protein